MKIEIITNKKIKIILDINDMANLSLSYKDMDYKDEKTKNAILDILIYINIKKSINLINKHLFIEVFPDLQGGCVMYINIANKQCKIKKEILPHSENLTTILETPIIFKFENLDNLSQVCKKLSEQYSHIILKSSLYSEKNNYFLLIYTYNKVDSKIIFLSSEYGLFFGKGDIKAALVKEHFEQIIKKDAIQNLIKCI